MINLERECDLLRWCHPSEVCSHGSDILPGGGRVTCSYLDGVILAKSVPRVPIFYLKVGWSRAGHVLVTCSYLDGFLVARPVLMVLIFYLEVGGSHDPTWMASSWRGLCPWS
jgi:hypothetical protein